MENKMELSDALLMTELEYGLKRCLAERPDVRSHILTVSELTDYTAWMMDQYGHGLSVQRQEQLFQGIHADRSGPMMILGKDMLRNPDDAGALARLSSQWGNQHEESAVAAGQDISAWKMIRYMPAHWHQNDYFEIYYCISGECPVYFTNEIVTVRPGTVLIVAPDISHANPCYGDDKVLIYYNIRSSTFDQVFWKQISSDNLMSGFFRQALSGKIPNSYLYFETDGDAEIRTLLWRVFEEYQENRLYSSGLMNAYMSACFILLMRSYEGTVRLPRTENFYWKHEYSAILNYIQTHYADTSLADLASHFHYSEKQLRRIVKTYTGMSYSGLITKLRMEQAARLLRRNAASISDISLQAGYSTVSSFYRAFERYYGCTPRDYICN